MASEILRNLLCGNGTEKLAIIACFFLENTSDFLNLLSLSCGAYFFFFKSTLNNTFLVVELLKGFWCRQNRLAVGNFRANRS